MSLVINFSAFINHVTDENRFDERLETSSDMSPMKRYESFHILKFKNI